MTVAENIAFLVGDHLRFASPEYLQRKATREPCRRAGQVRPPRADPGGLQPRALRCQRHRPPAGSSELDRVVGPTNQITKFKTQVATYRGDHTWLYNACWKFLAPENLGTFFIEATASGEHFANRYQVLDNLVASRGLLLPGGITLDPATVDIYRDASVATPTRRPRPFNKKTKKGTSDHLPITALLTC